MNGTKPVMKWLPQSRSGGSVRTDQSTAERALLEISAIEVYR